MGKSLICHNFWCQKVIPLVYSESLSYYEDLCKVYDIINKMINDNKLMVEELEDIKKDLETIQDWIDNYDTTYIEMLINEYLNTHLASMIFVEINKDGYIVYNIPETWNDITFNTTGLDIETALQPEYGHLVLSY